MSWRQRVTGVGTSVRSGIGTVGRRLSLVEITRWLILGSLALFAILAAVASLPLELGWLSSVRWVARSLVVAGVVIGAIGTLTGVSVLAAGKWVRQRLSGASRAVQGTAALLSLALFVAVAAIPVSLLLRREPAPQPKLLRQAVELPVGATAIPSQIRQDSSGAIWFVDAGDLIKPDADEMGRLSEDGTSINVRLPAANMEPDEPISIGDFTTVGTDAWVLFNGFQQRVAVFDEAGRMKGLYPVTGAKALEADARGIIWVATLTGGEIRRPNLAEIDPASGSTRWHPFPPDVRADNIELHFDAAGQVAWIATTSNADEKRIDIWAYRDGVVRPFAYRQPTLRVGPIGAPEFAVDRQGVLWFAVWGDLLAVPPRGAARILHLNNTQGVLDLTPAHDAGVVALVVADSTYADKAVSPLRDFLLHVPAYDTKVFPSYFRVPSPLWGTGGSKGSPHVSLGDRGDVMVTVPGRHSVFRFPRGVLSPPVIVTGPVVAQVDRMTRKALPEPYVGSEDAGPVGAAEWRANFAVDIERSRKARVALDEVSVGLPAEAGPAVDNLREALRIQEAAIAARLKDGASLDAKHYVASFRAKVLRDTLIAANGLRELCGLPRLDFDRNDVWDAARTPDQQ